jgi:hypothetical protein
MRRYIEELDVELVEELYHNRISPFGEIVAIVDWSYKSARSGNEARDNHIMLLAAYSYLVEANVPSHGLLITG